MEKQKRSSFSGTLGFIMAAAGSAVGLGNIWRFPYLAAKDGGGTFLVIYVILVLTFGFTLLTTVITIGRKTGQGPLTAFGCLHPKWKPLGVVACLIPAIILPYYCAIGGWVIKYMLVYLTGNGSAAAADGYFTSFISGTWQPIVLMLVYLGITFFVVYNGVEGGIERCSKIMMPILFVIIIAISVYSMTLSYTDAAGVTRTGLEGLKIYLVPDFTGMTLQQFFIILMDAMGQLFFSISVAMGIMVAYGSYARKDSNLMSSINQIEFFDSAVAILAGMMIIPAVFTFMGREGMSSGPGLMFVSLPKVFDSMGRMSGIVGFVFFVMVVFAAVTSSISIMEAIVSSLMDKFHWSRKKGTILVTLYAFVFGLIVCFGYNYLYFEVTLPNGTVGQILDILDYISNNCLMPLCALFECILIGWVVGPRTVIDEVTQGKYKFHRRGLYIVMIKVIAPVLLILLFLQSFGILTL